MAVNNGSVKIKYFCPICDQEIKGKFCKNCKTFVKPYAQARAFHLNERHNHKTTTTMGGGTDTTDCEYGYHDTYRKQDSEYSRAEMEQNEYLKPKAFVTKPIINNTNQTKNSPNAIKFVKGFIIVWLVMVCVAVAISVIRSMKLKSTDFEDFISGIFGDNSYVITEDVDTYDENEEIVDADDEDGYSDFDIYAIDYNSIDKSACERIREDIVGDNGTVQSDVFYDDIMAEGEPCNGYVHYGQDIDTALKLFYESIYKNYTVDDINTQGMHNYIQTTADGEVTSYYLNRFTVEFEDTDYLVDIVADTVDQRIMYVSCSGSQWRKVRELTEALLSAVDENAAESEISQFKDDFRTAIYSGEDSSKLICGDSVIFIGNGTQDDDSLVNVYFMYKNIE